MIRNPILFATLSLLAVLTHGIAHADNSQNVNRFPYGVFDKSDAEGKFETRSPIITGSSEWKEYRQRMLDIFLKYNINTVINTPYLNDSHARYVMDQLHENDISVIFQPRHPFYRKTAHSLPGNAPNSLYRHPSIIAYKIMDEPKDMKKLEKMKRWYSIIEQHYDLPIITAFIGELMGEPNPDFIKDTKAYHKRKKIPYRPIPDFEILAWDRLDSRIRFARHYPFRRTYDLVNWHKDKMTMPFQDWCEYMETASDTPWWYIPQLLGKGIEKTRKAYWRVPTADEMNAMIHTALANGARGIIGWGIPSFDVVRKPTRKLLIDENLDAVKARDGSIPMERFGEIGELVSRHADLLLNHTRGNTTIIKDNDEVIAVPREDKRTNDRYIYAVNLNTESTNKVTLELQANDNITRAKDIYTQRVFNAAPVSQKHRLILNLGPGEAVFLHLH